MIRRAAIASVSIGIALLAKSAQAQSVGVESAPDPWGPWTSATAVLSLSQDDQSTARLSWPSADRRFFRIIGDTQAVLWDVQASPQGLELKFTPAEIPAPVISAVLPATVAAGATFRIEGENLKAYGIPPRVHFGGRELEVTESSQTHLSVRVPREGWKRCWNGSISTWMVLIRLDKSAGHSLTVSGIPASPPEDLSVTRGAAVQGHVMTVRAEGLSTDPAKNLFLVAGQLVAATSYTPDWMDGYGRVEVPVPLTSTTGPTTLKARRLDGDGASWSDSVSFTIHEPTDLRIDGFLSGGSQFISPFSGYPAADSFDPYDIEWILTGEGFSTVCSRLATDAGRFEVEFDRGGQIITLTALALSDERARIIQFGATTDEEAGLRSIQAGDTFSLRAVGREAVDLSAIASPAIEVRCGRRQVLGETQAIWLPFEDGAEFTVAAGSLLGFFPNGPGPFTLNAPSLWPGNLGIEGRWLCAAPGLGAHTLTDLGQGRSATLRVVPLYSYSDSVEFGFEDSRFREDGILLGWGGLRIEIPAGALPASPIRSWYRVTITQDYHEDASFDSTVSDGRRRFSIRFSPEPTALWEPITITMPYDPEELSGEVQLGKWNPDAQLYFPIPSQPGAAGKRILVMPPGDYSGASPAVSALSRQSDRDLRPQLWGYPGTTLGDLLDNLGVWSNNGKTSDFVDEDHRIRVDVVKDPSSTDHVSDEVARRVLEVAGFTHTFLTSHSWSAPEDWTVIYIRDLGNPNDVAGSTTKGVFGQPYVYINSRITGKKLDTTVAHEMTHALQRVMTVNLTTKWIDEAVANWAAYELLGSNGSDVVTDINTAPEFATRSIPSTFTGGYGGEEQYAASALIIWLAKTGGLNVPAKIYQSISGNPLNWERARAVLSSATGITSYDLVTEFALAYWMQTYEPVDALSLGIPDREMRDWTPVIWTQQRPDTSSAALDIRLDPTFAPSLQGKPLVVRAAGEGVSYRVFGCQGLPGLAPQSAQQVAHLTSSSPNLQLGSYDGRYAYYRVVGINFTESAAESTFTFVAPRCNGPSPNMGSKQGGYEVTLGGTGLGSTVGSVHVGGFSAEIVSWSDTGIVFKQINVGDTTGDWPLSITTAEGAEVSAGTFRFTSP